jgi:predicted glycosyltransferase
VIKQKDILEKLLQDEGLTYTKIRKGRGKGKLGLVRSVLQMEHGMVRFIRKNKIDLLAGTTLSFAARVFTKAKVISVNEDDAAVVPMFAKLSYPFANAILNPRVCDSGKWDAKATKYESYQELAYLHPNHFTPDKQVVEKYFSAEKPYFIMRFAKLNAHHDSGIQGINTEIAQRLIDILKPYGDIYITAERELEPQFEQYRIKINPLDMHDVMAFAQLYIGDSQTMAAEAGVLGVPFVRFNDFVDRIGYLRELEDFYKLGFGIKTNEIEKLYFIVSELVTMKNRKDIFQERRRKMLSEKIDYAKFLTWFIENYPESHKIMTENPDYQYNFK